MAPVISTNRAATSCDACNGHIDDCPMVHFLAPATCNHVFHMDCLIDQVFARMHCPICRVEIRTAEMATDHYKAFRRMRLVDIFEEGIMRANLKRLRAVGARKRREIRAMKVSITWGMK
jgi:hypothetical protein